MKKKVISVMLAVILVFIPAVNAFAAGTAVQKCPLINIHGFMAKDIHAIAGDPDSEVVWPPSADSILKTAAKISPYIVGFAIDRDWDKFAINAFPAVGELFAPVCCDVNGEITNGTGICFEYPARETVTADGEYDFDYDWRLDPMVVAGQLNDFIDYILECSGAQKVSLICHSLGGVITLSYLTLYGNEKIDGVCFLSTAIYGESYNGQLMSGNISLVADSITEYLRGTFSETDYPYFLAGIFDVLNQLGILDIICQCGNYAVDQVLDYAAHEAILPLFGQWTPIWAMVPDEYLDTAMDYVFGNIFSNDGIDHSRLYEKVTAYNEIVRANREETLNALNENATVIVISGYGYTPIPIIPDWKKLTDNNVDTKNTSFGAVTAPYGETLSDEYLASADPEYINPDKNIDASTCLFPEQTWIIKNFNHNSRGSGVEEMMRTMLFTDEQPTVDTFEEYPRFLIYSSKDSTLSPYTEAIAAPTGLQVIILIFTDIFNMIKSLFAK